MASLTRWIETTLRLRVNPRKSAVDRPWKRTFLGFTLSRRDKKLKVADKAIDKLKGRVRQLSQRTKGHKVERIVEELRTSLLRWRAYFGITEVRSPLADLDKWIRRRLRCWLSGTAQAWRLGARSLEHQQERTRPMAHLENPGAHARDADEILQKPGAAQSGRCQRMSSRYSTQRTAGYVIRMSGGVRGRGREVPSYLD